MTITKQRYTAGFRERYAMEHGNCNRKIASNGHLLLIYTYSKFVPYQDANGATYDKTEERWVN